jgi:hypothetical protein
MNFELVKNGITIIGDQVVVTDRTHAFCRFNLLNQPLGTYDLVAIKESGERTLLKDAFTIEIGQPLSLATNILRPPSTRPGRIITIQVEYQNTGNTDIYNPIIKLTSLAGAPIALDREGLAEGLTSLELKLTELNAPKNVLRPGALGTITVYAQATAKPAFIILIPELAFVSLENK